MNEPKPETSPKPIGALIFGILAWLPLVVFFGSTTYADRHTAFNVAVAIYGCIAFGTGAIFALLGCIVHHVHRKRAPDDDHLLWRITFLLNYGFFAFTIANLIITFAGSKTPNLP